MRELWVMGGSHHRRCELHTTQQKSTRGSCKEEVNEGLEHGSQPHAALTCMGHANAPTHDVTVPRQVGTNFRSLEQNRIRKVWGRQILRSGQNFETVGEKLLMCMHLLRSEAVSWSDEQGDRATRQ
jgi:hypothetical protein